MNPLTTVNRFPFHLRSLVPVLFVAWQALGFPGLLLASDAGADPGGLRTLTAETDDGSLVLALGAQVRGADSAGRAALENALLAVATDKRATIEGRTAACHLIAGIGTDASVQALGPFLTDPALAHAARYALEGIPGRLTDEALLAALSRARRDIRLGIIDALSVRRTEAAVNPLARLARSSDADLAAASIRALGAIGNPAALKALVSLKPRGALVAVRDGAILVAADRLVGSEGNAREVIAAVQPLAATGHPLPVRSAALRLVIAAHPAGERAGMIQALLQAAEPALWQVGADSLDLAGGEAGCAALAAGASELRAEARAMLIEGLSARGCAAVLEPARAALGAEDGGVRVAGIRALGRLGNAGDVAGLLAVAGEPGAVGDEACGALAALPDARVDALLAREFARAEPAVRELLPGILAGRLAVEAIPQLLDAARAADRDLATEIYRAVGVMGDASVVPELFEHWIAAAGPARAPVERAIVAIGRRFPKGEATRVVVAESSAATPELREALVRMAGGIGDPVALEFLTPLVVNDPHDEAALRALMAWQSPEAALVLEKLVGRESIPESQRVSIWQAMLRMCADGYRGDRAAAVKGFEACLVTASTPEQRSRVIEAVEDLSGREIEGLLKGWVLRPEVADEASAALQRLQERQRR